jgi:hypothetical protein
MKLFKLTVCLVTLFSMAPAAMAAVGEMDKNEIRDGQLICLGNGSGLKDGRGLATTSNKRESSYESSETSSAQ